MGELIKESGKAQRKRRKWCHELRKKLMEEQSEVATIPKGLLRVRAEKHLLGEASRSRVPLAIMEETGL